MRSASISFDQARLIRHNQILARNGIDPSGNVVFTSRSHLVCLTDDSRDAIGFQGCDTAMNDELLSTSPFLVGYCVFDSLFCVCSHAIPLTLLSLSHL